jgi:long-chain fatty acid transport protein
MRKLFSLTVLIALSMSGLWAQNGTRLIGFDALTTGRGGTVTGYFDNPSLIMNNPAGLSFLKNSQTDLSFSLMAPRVHFQNDLNNTYGKNNLFPLGCLSYAQKGKDKIAFGFGLFTQGGMGADFNLNHALYKDETGNYMPQPYHSKFAVMQGGASIAYKITDQFSVGLTADVVYAQVEFKMPMAMPPTMMKGVVDPQTGLTFGDLFAAPNTMGGFGYDEVVASADMSGLKAFGFNGKVGLAYQPNNKLSVGLNYSSPINLTYKKGTAAMDMTYQMNNAFGRLMGMILQQNPDMSMQDAQAAAMNMFAGLGIDLTKGAKDVYTAKASFGLPQSVAAGISYAASKKLRLAFDAEWINWANAFDQMNITLTNGTNPNINKMMGSAGSLTMAFPLNWKNTIVLRTGAELAASSKLTLRAGYVYGSNPVPSTTVFPVFPAVVKHHVTAGASVKLSRSFRLNAAYEYAFRSNQKATANSYIAKEYNNSISSLENHIFHVSLSWLLK